MTVASLVTEVRMALLTLDRDPYIKLPRKKSNLQDMLYDLRVEQHEVGGILKEQS